jgi:hypothetical protein
MVERVLRIWRMWRVVTVERLWRVVTMVTVVTVGIQTCSCEKRKPQWKHTTLAY